MTVSIAVLSCKNTEEPVSAENYKIENVQSIQMQKFSDALRTIGKNGKLYVG